MRGIPREAQIIDQHSCDGRPGAAGRAATAVPAACRRNCPRCRSGGCPCAWPAGSGCHRSQIGRQKPRHWLRVGKDKARGQTRPIHQLSLKRLLTMKHSLTLLLAHSRSGHQRHLRRADTADRREQVQERAEATSYEAGTQRPKARASAAAQRPPPVQPCGIPAPGPAITAPAAGLLALKSKTCRFLEHLSFSSKLVHWTFPAKQLLSLRGGGLAPAANHCSPRDLRPQRPGSISSTDGSTPGWNSGPRFSSPFISFLNHLWRQGPLLPGRSFS